MKVKVWVSLSLVGCERNSLIEVDDDADDEEIEEIAKDWMFEHIDWGWEKP